MDITNQELRELPGEDREDAIDDGGEGEGDADEVGPKGQYL